MPQREVDESEFLAATNVVRAVNEMLANPKARGMLLEARKVANPNAVIPELDAAAPVKSEIAKLREEMVAERELRAKERQEAEERRRLDDFRALWNRQRDALRQSGWTDDGIAQIEKHAETRGIPDLEVAAAHYEKLHPPAEPVAPTGGGAWNLFDTPAPDDTFVKDLMASKGDNDQALDREIAATIKDFRSSQAGRR